jgi:hypothetical protein
MSELGDYQVRAQRRRIGAGRIILDRIDSDSADSDFRTFGFENNKKKVAGRLQLTGGRRRAWIGNERGLLDTYPSSEADGSGDPVSRDETGRHIDAAFSGRGELHTAWTTSTGSNTVLSRRKVPS